MKIQNYLSYIEFLQILNNLTKIDSFPFLITLSCFLFHNICPHFIYYPLWINLFILLNTRSKSERGLPLFPIDGIVFGSCQILNVCHRIVEGINMETSPLYRVKLIDLEMKMVKSKNRYYMHIMVLI